MAILARRKTVPGALLLGIGLFSSTSLAAPEERIGASASDTASGFSVTGPLDGDRFSLEPVSLWRGERSSRSWWWGVRFERPWLLGAILQIHGSLQGILHDAPKQYLWQWSADGESWSDLAETRVERERRIFRIHRLSKALLVQHLRIHISECVGEAPALRDVEFFSDPAEKIPFPDWIVAVSTTESSRLPGETELFLRLALMCKGWKHVPAQQVWIGDFDEKFLEVEPNPLCVFLSGNILEWCQRTRKHFQGLEEVLKRRSVPIWGSCGGAQALAILEDTGTGKPWDCPRCRDPGKPKLPIYSHIGHTGEAPCGDYSKNIAERGKFKVRKTVEDPVFEGLPEVFEVMESHVGQIAFLSEGWIRIATKGPGALTENQCVRIRDRYIYAAQFHIEMGGTPESSRRIMENFLKLAKSWGGYLQRGKPVFVPEELKKK